MTPLPAGPNRVGDQGEGGVVVLLVVVDDDAVVAVVVEVDVDVVLGAVVWVRDRVVLVVPLPLPYELLTDRWVPGTCVEPLVSFTGWGRVGSAWVLMSQSWSSSLKMARPM